MESLVICNEWVSLKDVKNVWIYGVTIRIAYHNSDNVILHPEDNQQEVFEKIVSALQQLEQQKTQRPRIL